MPAVVRLPLVLSFATTLGFSLRYPAPAGAAVTREEVERALRDGVNYLKSEQQDDGSWSEAEGKAPGGSTSLVTLALLTAGEPPDAPHVVHALEFLRTPAPDQVKSTYGVALQTMVLAAADPERYRLKIAANVEWLEDAQIKAGDHVNWPGSWSYTAAKTQRGDNSNTQKDFGPENPKRGALRIAKLRHGGDWNVAPLAVPRLMDTLRKPPLNFDVVLNPEELFPRDPTLVNYPLVYMHGRAAFALAPEDITALRRHLEPGGGMLFADAACGSLEFDAAFRRFVLELLPNNPLMPIPAGDDLYTPKVGFDLRNVQFNKAAGGSRDFPQLEGIKLGKRWAVIYSKYDLGCSLERHQGPGCKGYSSESALRIAANVVIYATLP